MEKEKLEQNEDQYVPQNGMELFRDKDGNFITRDSFWTVGPRDFEY